MLYYLLYSFSFIIVWGLLFLSPDKPGLLGLWIGLVYSFYSTYYIRCWQEKETVGLKLIKIIGPLFYVLMFLTYTHFDLYLFINPIFIGFLCFIPSFFDSGKYPKPLSQLSVIIVLSFYTFWGYHYWQNRYEAVVFPNFHLPVNEENSPKPNLMNFHFINRDLDTVSLFTSQAHYTIIEIWNEKHPSCWYSLRQMQPFYQRMEGPSVRYFYVYLSLAQNSRLDYNLLFSYPKIKDSNRILADINFVAATGLSRVPSFLVFDDKGKPIFEQEGYDPGAYIELQQKIKKAIENNEL